MKLKSTKGFTLLELLIVVVIISILSIAVLFVLNPAETLKKTRDAQRFADLATLKNVLAIYVSTVATPDLTGTGTVNQYCKVSSTSYAASTAKIYYSVPNSVTSISDTALDGGSGSLPGAGQSATATTTPMTNGIGWIPVNFGAISGGSPISNLPVDPINIISDGGNIAATDKVYRYLCNGADNTFEINAVLESTAFTSDDDRRAKDGGNNASYYETGTNLQLLGTGSNF